MSEILERAIWEAISAWRERPENATLVRVVSLRALSAVMGEEITRKHAYTFARDEWEDTGDDSVLLTNLRPLAKDVIAAILPVKGG